MIPSIAVATYGGAGSSRAPRVRRRSRAQVRSSRAAGSWTPVIPRSLQEIPQTPIAVSNSVIPGAFALISSFLSQSDVQAIAY